MSDETKEPPSYRRHQEIVFWPIDHIKGDGSHILADQRKRQPCSAAKDLYKELAAKSPRLYALV